MDRPSLSPSTRVATENEMRHDAMYLCNGDGDGDGHCDGDGDGDGDDHGVAWPGAAWCCVVCTSLS